MRLFPYMVHIVFAMEETLGVCEAVQTAEYKNRVATAMWNAENQSRISRSIFARNSYVCYETLGCFSRHPIGELPENPMKIPPQFKLFTNVSFPRRLWLLSVPRGGYDLHREKSTGQFPKVQLTRFLVECDAGRCIPIQHLTQIGRSHITKSSGESTQGLDSNFAWLRRPRQLEMDAQTDIDRGQLPAPATSNEFHELLDYQTARGDFGFFWDR